MDHLDTNLLLVIGVYCDPCTLSHLRRSSNAMAVLKTGICLPGVILKALGIDSTSMATIHDDICIMRDVIHEDPTWIFELWTVISDYLYHETPAIRRGAYRRPPTGRIPRVISLTEARCAATWATNTGYKVRALRHEIYRLGRFHMRMWKRHAPTAIALIY